MYESSRESVISTLSDYQAEHSISNLKKVCLEISEFCLSLYASTENEEERKIFRNMITKVKEKTLWFRGSYSLFFRSVKKWKLYKKIIVFDIILMSELPLSQWYFLYINRVVRNATRNKKLKLLVVAQLKGVECRGKTRHLSITTSTQKFWRFIFVKENKLTFN